MAFVKNIAWGFNIFLLGCPGQKSRKSDQAESRVSVAHQEQSGRKLGRKGTIIAREHGSEAWICLESVWASNWEPDRREQHLMHMTWELLKFMLGRKEPNTLKSKNEDLVSTDLRRRLSKWRVNFRNVKKKQQFSRHVEGLQSVREEPDYIDNKSISLMLEDYVVFKIDNWEIKRWMQKRNCSKWRWTNGEQLCAWGKIRLGHCQ